MVTLSLQCAYVAYKLRKRVTVRRFIRMHLSKVKLGLATGTAALIFVTASDFAPITAYATTLSSAGGAPVCVGAK